MKQMSVFFFVKRRGLILRALLCWVLGLVILLNDETSNYDQRFNLRGNQKQSEQIVIITVKQSEVSSAYFNRTQFRGDFEQLTDMTDSFFWNQKIWYQLLSKILAQQPEKIGVTLYFGDNIGDVHLSPQETQVFTNSKIIWSSTSNYLEQELAPLFMNSEANNVATNSITKDEDGIVRRIFPTDENHMSEALTGKKWPDSLSGLVINYRGTGEAFSHISASEVLFDELPENFLKNKIVLIGSEPSDSQKFMTPLGPQTRAEVLAQVTDNLANARPIKRLHFGWYALLMALFTALAVYLISNHPQKVAIMFFTWIMTLALALSVWTFDTFYIWTPALSPAAVMIITWIVFVGYQANKIEQMHFQLQQEQRALQELEQLKNNFVSLISHDLKTPIAKIQAIVDRMILENGENEKINSDLKNLRGCSDELNRYIQSVLKLLRLESRDFHLNKEVGDINEVIDDVIIQLRPLAAAKGIHLQTQLEPMFSVEFDLTLVREVVLNLIENAIKYTGPGGLVEVRSEEIDNVIRVSVKDSGEGIKATDLDKVWGKFTRGSDQDMKSKGTGLGLYLVKYFIELHRGTVHLESEYGVGTLVTFTLPIDEEESELNPSEAASTTEKLT